MSGMLK